MTYFIGHPPRVQNKLENDEDCLQRAKKSGSVDIIVPFLDKETETSKG